MNSSLSVGFTRDEVRATIRSLTDGGASVELNTVIDRLMNSGSAAAMANRGNWGYR